MATAELADVSRSFRSVMGESAGQFRQAAAASAANLSKIVKDLATTFSSQRKDIIDLHNTIAEGQYASEQTNEKVDGLTRIFQESVSLQTSMLGSLNNISKNIKILNDTTESMSRSLNNSLVGQGTTSVISSLASGFSNVATALGAAAVGGAMGYGASQMFGGGGQTTTDSSVGKGSKAFQSVVPRLSQDLQKDFPGLTKEDISAIIGNLGEESGGFSQMSEAGGSGPGRGWAQWTSPDRKAKFLENVQKHGGDLANYEANYETLKAELKGQYAGALKEMMAAQGLERKTHTFMKKFENPGVEHFDVRMRYAQRAMNNVSESISTPSTISDASKMTTPEAVPSATSPRTETIGKEGGHGPISGAMHGESHAEKMENYASLPSGDIVALGNTLKKMGMDISEHKAFGGVHPVHKGRAHYEGRAIDINLTHGKDIEANNPAAGAKFDQLADKLTKLGYKVFWRESGPYGAAGHNNHLHAEIPRGGATPVPDTYQIKGTPEQRALEGATPTTATAAVTPGSSGAGTAAPSMTAAEPVSQAPMMQNAMAPAASSFPMGQLMGMLGGMMPMGLGGILGSVLPMIGSALEGIESTPMPFAELTPKPTVSNQNVQRVKEAAIESQRMAETQTPQAYAGQNVPSPQGGTGSMSPSDTSGYAYNLPGDVGWPDWAALIGGNHWEEMKHYKKHMAG